MQNSISELGIQVWQQSHGGKGKAGCHLKNSWLMFGKVWTAARLCALSSGPFRLFYCLVLLLNSSQPCMKATLTAWNPCNCCCLSAGFITGEWLPLQWQQHGTVHWLVLYCIVLFNASRSNKVTLFILSQCPGKAWVIFMWIGGEWKFELMDESSHNTVI